MTEPISSTQLQRLSDFVAGHFGLHFPEERWPDLHRGVSSAARESGCSDLHRYVDELLSSTRRQAQVLANYLTVGETYFFREARSLEVLEKNIVPELIRRHAGRGIRIWSAGCATGEEPFSIAIVLSKLVADLKNCDVEILATDLNTKALQKASEGRYGEWSFRSTPAWVRSNHFERVGENRWAIRSPIKKVVSFASLNLVDDSLHPHSISANRFDVIFCRNVLMYFTPEVMRKVVRKLYSSLATDGWLIVSASETSQELFSGFAATDFGGVTLYRKSAPTPQKTCISTSVAYGVSEVEPAPFTQRFEISEHTKTSSSSAHQRSRGQETYSENAGEPSTAHREAARSHELRRQEDSQSTVGKFPSQETNGNDAQAMLLLARAYADQGNLSTALIWCDKAIAADKMAARAYYLRATILQEQGFLSDAVFAFKQTVYVEPKFVLGHFCLGNLALRQGRFKESEKQFENVLLLLARYEPEEIVPESEGISVGTLREMVASRRGDLASIIPEAEVSQRTFRRDSGHPVEMTRSR